MSLHVDNNGKVFGVRGVVNEKSSQGARWKCFNSTRYTFLV